MKTQLFLSAALAVSAVVMPGAASACALHMASMEAGHHEYAIGEMKVSHPRSRATPPNAPAGVVYFEVVNAGSADRLVAVKGEVSQTIELHTHIKDGDVMRMRKVEAIDIAAGETTKLEPGGLHVMLIGLNEPLTEGQAFPLTLVFEEAGEVEVEVHTHGAGGGHMDHSGHGHGGHGDGGHSHGDHHHGEGGHSH